MLGDPRAIALITPLAVEDTSIKFATESLVRLGALRRGAIGGVDVAQGAPGSRDFGECQTGPLLPRLGLPAPHDCTTRRRSAALSGEHARRASPSAQHGALVALGIKRTDATRADGR